MRALVLSDTHLGAWTGDDLLRHDTYLERLAPHLDDVDELILLGDLFDLLFGSLEDAFGAASGLFDLVRENLQGGRFVFVAGNHDHHFVVREQEDIREFKAVGATSDEDRERVIRGQALRELFARRLEGVEIEISYPTYEFGDVLLAHGHYLDPHARLAGPVGSRLLTRALWAIAAGGKEDPKTEDDYEGVIRLLTEVLYSIAQLPHGTTAQRNVFGQVQRAAKLVSAARAPARGVKDLSSAIAERLRRADVPAPDPVPGGEAISMAEYHRAQAEDQRRATAEEFRPGQEMGYPIVRVVHPGDPRDVALEAFAQSVRNLGWDRGHERIVFAHTHQPIDGATAPQTPGVRYWNTGCWIYEPDLGSHESYVRYLKNAWPGTGVVIDTEEEDPRVIEVLADLNPLTGGPGIPRHAPPAPGGPSANGAGDA